MANAIRALAMDAVGRRIRPRPADGRRRHRDRAVHRFLKFDPADPAWPDRDRFVLSAGHGSMLIYALLHLLGYDGMTIDQIKRFPPAQLDHRGPSEHGRPGVETTTGPARPGLANAVGMAMAERHLATVFGREVVDHHLCSRQTAT
jgi:transketolase